MSIELSDERCGLHLDTHVGVLVVPDKSSMGSSITFKDYYGKEIGCIHITSFKAPRFVKLYDVNMDMAKALYL